METKKLETLAIDSLWYLLYEQVDFFVKKTDVICNIYNECIELSTISSQNKNNIKQLFERQLTTPFNYALNAIKMATRFNNESSLTEFENGILNYRGLSRTRICMGLVNKVNTYYPEDDFQFLLATLLTNFDYSNSDYANKSMFEIMCEFITNRPSLHTSDERMVANSFIQSNEYSDIINSLDYCFDTYLAKLIKEFSLSPEMNKEKNFYREVPYKIAKEVTRRFDRRDYYSRNRIIASDLARYILNNYYN